MKFAAMLAVAALAIPGLASAHAHALRTNPVADSKGKAPSSIHVAFSEDVKPAFTGLEVTGPGGKVAVAKPTYDDAKKEMDVSVPGTLKPGAYTVKWHAAAGDGHRSTGAFGFTVEP